MHPCSPWVTFKLGQAQQTLTDTIPHRVLF